MINFSRNARAVPDMLSDHLQIIAIVERTGQSRIDMSNKVSLIAKSVLVHIFYIAYLRSTSNSSLFSKLVADYNVRG